MEQKDLLQVLKELTLLFYQGELTADEFNSTKELLLATLRTAHPSWTLDEMMLAALDVPASDTLVPSTSKRTDNVGEAMGELLNLFEAGDLSDEEYQLTTELLLNHAQQSHTDLQSAQPVADPTIPIIPHLAHVAMRSHGDRALVAAHQSIAVGQTLLHRYQLDALLGQGATGQVFLCTDHMRGGVYALKLIHPHLAHDKDQRHRFMKELHSAERLAHPGIVRTYNLEEDTSTGVLFYTMEYVEGDTLDAILRRAEVRGHVPLMPLNWSRQLLAELTHILEYIHARGLVYRDLKPSNVMITPDGYIKLMDFAIAENLEKTAVGPLAAFAGLGYYMAPEQQRGKGEVKPAADVFSLGVLAYQLLTGELPIGRVARPSHLWPTLSPHVDEVLLRAMDPRPSRRLPTPRIFWQALSDALSLLQLDQHGHPAEFQPPLTPYPRHAFDSHSDASGVQYDSGVHYSSVDSGAHAHPSSASGPSFEHPLSAEYSAISHSFSGPEFNATPSSSDHTYQAAEAQLGKAPDTDVYQPSYRDDLTAHEDRMATEPELPAALPEETHSFDESGVPTQDQLQEVAHPQPVAVKVASQHRKTPRPQQSWFSPPVELLPATTSGDALSAPERRFSTVTVNKLAEAPRKPPRRQSSPIPVLSQRQPMAPPMRPLAKTPPPPSQVPIGRKDPATETTLPEVSTISSANQAITEPTHLDAPSVAPEDTSPTSSELAATESENTQELDAVSEEISQTAEEVEQIHAPETDESIQDPVVDVEAHTKEETIDSEPPNEVDELDEADTPTDTTASIATETEDTISSTAEQNAADETETQLDVSPLPPSPEESLAEAEAADTEKNPLDSVEPVAATKEVSEEEAETGPPPTTEEAFLTLMPKYTPLPPTRTPGESAQPPAEEPTIPLLPPAPKAFEHRFLEARDGTPLLRLIKIPAGSFIMGSRGAVPLAYRSERPQRSVEMGTYWIAQTPITNLVWQIFIKESGYTCPHPDYLRHWRSGTFPKGKGEHPVVYIGRDDLDAFCTFYDVTLPTEAQWEKAARGKDGFLWPWGDQKPHPSLSNFLNAKIGDTTPVTSYPKGVSPYGLYDCSGNVWELCADNWDLLWLENMGDHPIDPFWQATNSDSYTMRGGYFNYHGRGLRCAFRFNSNKRDLHIGARVASPY